MPETLEKFGLGEIVFEQKVKEYKKYSLEELNEFKSRVVENIETISKILDISIDINNIDAATETISKILKELPTCPTDIIDRARETLKILSELDKKDYEIIDRLLFFQYYNIVPTTRELIGYTQSGNVRSWIHKSLRDEISEELSGKHYGIYGKNIEYKLITRTPLILFNSRYVRLNFLSENFFKLFETIIEYRKCYETNIKRLLLLNLKDLLVTLKAVNKAIEAKTERIKSYYLQTTLSRSECKIT